MASARPPHPRTSPRSSTTSSRIFGELPDETWFYPGHGDDSTLGAERPKVTEWCDRAAGDPAASTGSPADQGGPVRRTVPALPIARWVESMDAENSGPPRCRGGSACSATTPASSAPPAPQGPPSRRTVTASVGRRRPRHVVATATTMSDGADGTPGGRASDRPSAGHHDLILKRKIARVCDSFRQFRGEWMSGLT